MAKVLIFVDSEPRGEFRILDYTFNFARIPCPKELVSLGDDDGTGAAADYEVVLVHHAPLKPRGIDAEIYARRIFFPDALKALKQPQASNPYWKAGSRPRLRGRSHASKHVSQVAAQPTLSVVQLARK